MFIRHLPHESAFHRETYGAKHEWGLPEVLLEKLVYLYELDFWRNSDPKRRGPRPTPPVNPWAVEVREANADELDVKKADLEARDRARRGVADE